MGATHFFRARVVAVEAARLVLEADGLRLVTPAEPGLRPGQEVEVTLRPEKIHLEAGEPRPEPTGVGGVVESAV